MRITKDEARLLHYALEASLHDLYNEAPLSDIDKESFYETCRKLSKRLDSKDKRRTGRTSQDYYSDLLKRLINRNKKS